MQKIETLLKNIEGSVRKKHDSNWVVAVIQFKKYNPNTRTFEELERDVVLPYETYKEFVLLNWVLLMDTTFIYTLGDIFINLIYLRPWECHFICPVVYKLNTKHAYNGYRFFTNPMLISDFDDFFIPMDANSSFVNEAFKNTKILKNKPIDYDEAFTFLRVNIETPEARLNNIMVTITMLKLIVHRYLHSKSLIKILPDITLAYEHANDDTTMACFTAPYPWCGSLVDLINIYQTELKYNVDHVFEWELNALRRILNIPLLGVNLLSVYKQIFKTGIYNDEGAPVSAFMFDINANLRKRCDSTESNGFISFAGVHPMFHDNGSFIETSNLLKLMGISQKDLRILYTTNSYKKILKQQKKLIMEKSVIPFKLDPLTFLINKTVIKRKKLKLKNVKRVLFPNPFFIKNKHKAIMLLNEINKQLDFIKNDTNGLSDELLNTFNVIGEEVENIVVTLVNNVTNDVVIENNIMDKLINLHKRLTLLSNIIEQTDGMLTKLKLKLLTD